MSSLQLAVVGGLPPVSLGASLLSVGSSVVTAGSDVCASLLEVGSGEVGGVGGTVGVTLPVGGGVCGTTVEVDALGVTDVVVGDTLPGGVVDGETVGVTVEFGATGAAVLEAVAVGFVVASLAGCPQAVSSNSVDIAHRDRCVPRRRAEREWGDGMGAKRKAMGRRVS
jgi:hypothetical protein